MADKNKRLDDEIAYEYALDAVTELRGRLMAGARGSGMTLTPTECKILVPMVKNPPRPKGRPAGRSVIYEPWIAIYCARLATRGKPLKAAVAATAEKFGISRSAVYAIRSSK
jgi:hypothetical protein